MRKMSWVGFAFLGTMVCYTEATQNRAFNPAFLSVQGVNSQSRRVHFTREDDENLCTLVRQFGDHNWKEVALRMEKTPRRCRERWVTYHQPRLTRTVWTYGDDEILLNLVKMCGNKWAKIAKYFENKSETQVRNRWYTIVNKFLTVEHKDELDQESPTVSRINPPSNLPVPSPLGLSAHPSYTQLQEPSYNTILQPQPIIFPQHHTRNRSEHRVVFGDLQREPSKTVQQPAARTQTEVGLYPNRGPVRPQGSAEGLLQQGSLGTFGTVTGSFFPNPFLNTADQAHLSSSASVSGVGSMDGFYCDDEMFQ